MPMNPDIWVDVEKWFHHLADLPEATRQLELEQIKATAPDIYTWVQALLKEDQDAHPLLSRSPQELLDDMQQDAGLLGSSIGAFVLAELIGQGAMGSVFLARRADGQFDQTVALKLMKPVIHDDKLQQLFKEERQILAGLNHPHIARLYDGGFTHNHRPYFTMEYITGLPVTEYCFRHPLDVKKRLAIFLQVCDAVGYAHRALVAHLDLKPKNIIVDQEGNVKLLDFGVSRFLKQPSFEKMVSENEEPSHRFTLAYAAPEQLIAGQVSTASDIYALGTILYELLTGVHPFHHLFDNRLALKQAILHEPPKGLKENSALPQGISPRYLHTDLNCIFQRAQRKKPEDRYVSVEALSHDIAAFLSGHPVIARKRTFAYVAGKFMARHRKMVTATALSFMLLFTTIAYYTLRLSQERDLARKEATRSAEIVNLLTDVFTAADPNTGNGDTLTAVQLLNQGMVKLESNLKNQPALLASMFMQISPIYLHLGQYAKADSLAHLAMNFHEEQWEAPHKTLAENLLLLGRVKFTTGKVDSAKMYALQAIDQYQQLKMDQAPEMAEALIELSYTYYSKGQYLPSDSILRLAYAIHSEKLQAPHIDLANDLHMIGTTLRKLGEYDEAERYLMESLRMKRKLYQEPHLEIAYTLNHMGSLKQNRGEWRASIPYTLQSLEQRRAILGPTHIETLASQSSLARAYTNVGVLDSAIFLREDALTKMRNIFPDGNYYVSSLTQSLAMVYLRNNDLAQAENLFRASIKLNEKLLPEDDVNRAYALSGLGRTLIQKGDYPAAQPFLQNALDLRSQYLPPGHELVGVSQQALGECLLAMENYPATITLLESAYTTLQKYPDKYEDALDTILQALADACHKSDYPEKAAHYLTLLQNR